MQRLLQVMALMLVGWMMAGGAQAQAVKVSSSIQEAINKHPGQMVYLPPGDYRIDKAIDIRTHGSGLFGPGRIIQTNPDQVIIEVTGANDVQLRDLTLTREEGKMDTDRQAIYARQCRNVLIDSVQVLDNRGRTAAISLEECGHGRVLNCVVQNYMRITIDDRTGSPDYGFAFRCIDGSGIGITQTSGTLVQGNRVVEYNLLPTPENQEKYGLGKFTKKNAQKGTIANQGTWDKEYAGNWHQGSAIVITAPENTDTIQILGNLVENAAQGVDIHADHVIMSNNIINNSFIGMKAMHGARNVMIIGNQFIKNDLWSIGLMSGAGSRATGVPIRESEKPETSVANVDGGSIIANNIISDFGRGNAAWMWKDAGGTPLRFDRGQKPVNPPVTDVIIQGNVIYDTGRDQVLVNGKPQVEAPRYPYAVRIEGDEGNTKGPMGLHFSNNLFHPGAQGISNVELKP